MFLKAEPFNNLAQFRRFISVPFDQGEELAKMRLIQLYDSLVLRRTKDILTLPGQIERERRLKLREDERDQYKRTESILNRYMRQQVSEHTNMERTSQFGLFQAHLQLRILCNHGTYQQLFSWKKHTIKDDIEREAMLSELGSNAEATCAGCKQPRPILGSSRMSGDFIEKCAHILCSECLEDTFGENDNPAGGRLRRHCPICRRFGRLATENPGITRDINGNVNMADAGQEYDISDKHHYFNATGYSTKMEALLRDVKEDLAQSKRYLDAVKSVNTQPPANTRLKHRVLMLDTYSRSHRSTL